VQIAEQVLTLKLTKTPGHNNAVG